MDFDWSGFPYIKKKFLYANNLHSKLHILNIVLVQINSMKNFPLLQSFFPCSKIDQDIGPQSKQNGCPIILAISVHVQYE